MAKVLANRPIAIVNFIRRSPTWIVLLIGLALLLVLVVRGLNIGPLHTDVIISRAWFHEVGVGGFAARYFEVNQRHPLVGPFYALAYSIFGENDLPYNLFFQAGRLFEGVFMAGLVYQLTGRRLFAVMAGLALLTTLIRVRELYQGINWYIEPTLAYLLISSYYYTLAVKYKRPALWLLSMIWYGIAILFYESSLPWIGVNLLIGWLLRPGQLWNVRAWRTFRDGLPTLLGGGGYAFALIFLFKPWQTLAPEVSTALPIRILNQLSTILTFPRVYAQTLGLTGGDGYWPLTLLCVLIALFVAFLVIRSAPRAAVDEAKTSESNPSLGYGAMLLLSLVMVTAAVLITTSQQMGEEVGDRISFGRSAGIMLLYTTLIFGLCGLLQTRWATRGKEALAGLLTAALLIGPGASTMLIYQQYAQQTRAEIARLTAALIAVNHTVYAPAYYVIVTHRDWVGSRMNDASDVLLHEIQQNIWNAGIGATVDILKTGAYPETYTNRPGTCQNQNDQASAAICLDQAVVHPSRFAVQPPQPYDNVVLLDYDSVAGTLTIMSRLALADLPDYNLTSAGPTELLTNPKRLAVP